MTVDRTNVKESLKFDYPKKEYLIKMNFEFRCAKISKEFATLMAIGLQRETSKKKNTSSQGQACRIHLTLRNKTCEHVRT
jgi:hypothetical protein